jgi:hypothetical protein
LGIVQYRWRRVGQWPGRVGHISWFLDIPLYNLAEAGRVLGVSAKTVRRLEDAGRLQRKELPGYSLGRITPRELFELKRERAEKARRARRLPSIPRIISLTDEMLGGIEDE